MRYHRTSKGFWAFLILSCFAVLSSCYHNGDHESVLRPFHRASIINRANFGSAATTKDDDYDSPAAYDFSNTDTTTAFAPTYPLLTATLGGGAGDPSSNPSLTLDRHSSTATTEPRSPGMSNGPEIESTSTAVSQESSNGETLSSSTTSVSDIRQDPVSQTDTQLDETVTITVTNFISSSSKRTEISYPISTSSDIQNSAMSSSSAASEGAISVITITSLHTVTLSISHNSSSTQQTTLQLSTSPGNATSTAGTISSQNSTYMGPVTSSGVSIITITRTETYTGVSNTTANATGQATSKEVATSTIDWPTPISRIPPFSASFNLSSVPGPVISSQVSGAATSVQSASSSNTTRTVFQNITVTLSEFPDTGSRKTGATSIAMPTLSASSNATDYVSSTRFSSTLYPVPSSTANLSSTKATANATNAGSSSMSISTEVITITVYPTTLETGDPADVTSVITLHSNSTTTVALTPYPLNNVNSSTLLTPEGRTTASSGLLDTESAGGWSTNLPTASANSGAVGTPGNTTTARSSDDYTRPTYVDTTCEHTDTTSQPAATSDTGAGSSSSSMGTSLNGTRTISLPSTLKTTVSRTQSVEDDDASAYPSASGKRLPGSPSYPWGGSGPLHRLQEPDF
ncbi:hypothetical protein MY10362_005762 [Beauveria mimosiformis]